MKVLIDKKPKCCVDCNFIGHIKAFNIFAKEETVSLGCTLLDQKIALELALIQRLKFCPLVEKGK